MGFICGEEFTQIFYVFTLNQIFPAPKVKMKNKNKTKA